MRSWVIIKTHLLFFCWNMLGLTNNTNWAAFNTVLAVCHVCPMSRENNMSNTWSWEGFVSSCQFLRAQRMPKQRLNISSLNTWVAERWSDSLNTLVESISNCDTLGIWWLGRMWKGLFDLLHGDSWSCHVYLLMWHIKSPWLFPEW